MTYPSCKPKLRPGCSGLCRLGVESIGGGSLHTRVAKLAERTIFAEPNLVVFGRRNVFAHEPKAASNKALIARVQASDLRIEHGAVERFDR
jgi:hypothetical protein